MLAGLPGLRKPHPEFIPISLVIGPLTTTHWPELLVVLVPHPDSAMASTTGNCSGLQPAITAMVATFSTVAVLQIEG
jgi:hypothetical protein